MDKKTLHHWQDLLGVNQVEYENEITKIEARDSLFKGSRDITNICTEGGSGLPDEAQHVHNIIDELIEAQVDSNLPQPKVTAFYEKDEKKAKLIEDMLRNELDRLPMETINDLQARLVPLQGSSFYWVDWDIMADGVYNGAIKAQVIHPKNLIPQDGVDTKLEDMDYFFLKIPQTKKYIEERYGVKVDNLSEEEPEVRQEDSVAADDLVTQYIAYYKNDNGGIGLYSWVCDTELINLEDYQARQLKRCTKCGEVILDEEPKIEKCPNCGGKKFKSTVEEYEELGMDIEVEAGVIPKDTESPIPVMNPDGTPQIDKLGNPVVGVKVTATKIPYYRPNLYPVIEQKNISAVQQFLGGSDADKIADQQNTINILSSKINDKLMKATSYVVMPPDTTLRTDGTEINVIYPKTPQAYNQIKVVNTEGNIQSDMMRMQDVYEEARQIIGITDSFQGRKDTTATSGVAKKFSAAQAAGRMESKKVMKHAAWSSMFELMFRLMLAYADERRSVIGESVEGKPVYKQFNKYDFLEQDNDGNYFWNDNFIFSTDTSAPLANNREIMWQETRLNLETGAYGNPQDIDTLILFWNKMELLHYPGASQTKEHLEQQKVELTEQEQQAGQAEQQAMQQQQQMEQQKQQQDFEIEKEKLRLEEKEINLKYQQEGEQEITPEIEQQIDQQARQDAMRDAQQVDEQAKQDAMRDAGMQGGAGIANQTTQENQF